MAAASFESYLVVLCVNVFCAHGTQRRPGLTALCGICCSQALRGARSLQHYGMQSRNLQSVTHLRSEIGPRIVADRISAGPLGAPCFGPSYAGQLVNSEELWCTFPSR